MKPLRMFRTVQSIVKHFTRGSKHEKRIRRIATMAATSAATSIATLTQGPNTSIAQYIHNPAR